MFQASAKEPAPKLYLLTNDDEFAVLYAKLEAALATGLVALLQIRRKKTLQAVNGKAKLYEEARRIVSLAKAHDVAVVMNDDIALAKKLGIKTGEAIWEAKLKAPGLVTISPDFAKYLRFSRLARKIYYDYTDQVEPFCIYEC